MYICANIDKLRSHRDDLQKQISLADRIVARIEQLQQEDLETFGMNEQLYRRQLQFAKDLALRLRKRQELLTEVIDLLSQAKRQLADHTEEALYQLSHEG